MIERNFLTPNEVAGELVTVAENKANLSLLQKIVLGIIAGAYIAFAAVASNTAAFQLMNNQGTLGLSKLLSAFVFSGGLILVVVCGSELFTVNNCKTAAYKLGNCICCKFCRLNSYSIHGSKVWTTRFCRINARRSNNQNSLH